ncbi:MAG: hypothetical protein A3F54_01885 [Candidatus Kerfeldbacteria bacterium RIFCSPHIGHO2_12_FULL_48_17]|uniref:Transcription regulator TrmB N-terminal domain-containing protein n=1 Tax=Candidatus Kerfeldbacteria bacterium RIFCSPHIGHO2_12_FULL_48_17 TaxID=1798542 RepID=A0A1G2AXG4_9BACT|nr:MAG: hypothetical protein A3F54_01885 [Candidatus Kerfeldbacteria bacterium RIFCSPHIGHO2_12_FULL_48_17]
MAEDNLQLKKALRSLGLTGRETNVYVAILALGKGTVSKIARQAGINRTTGYDILDTLMSKALVSMSGKKPRQEYIAESPSNILRYLKKEFQKSKQLLDKAEKVVPELKSIHKKGDRPKVLFYEGKAGVEFVYEDTLTSHEPIRAYAAIDDMHKALPHYFPKYYRRRAAKGIKIRGIVPETAISKERSKHDHEESREMAMVPGDKFYFSPEINIYDNKVMIASWREQLGIIIESEEIADAMKKVYELAWAEAKRLDAKIRQKKARS